MIAQDTMPPDAGADHWEGWKPEWQGKAAGKAAGKIAGNVAATPHAL